MMKWIFGKELSKESDVEGAAWFLQTGGNVKAEKLIEKGSVKPKGTFKKILAYSFC